MIYVIQQNDKRERGESIKTTLDRHEKIVTTIYI